MDETILQKLREEHREVQTLLIRIERCQDKILKQELYNEMKRHLIPHMEGEEQTLYAKLRTEVHDENAAELANDADYEHQEIKDLMEMMESETIGSGEWLELFSQFKESIQLHIEEEETLLFDEAKEDFSRDELIQFASEYEEAKSHASYH